MWSKIFHKTHILIIQYPIHTGFFISLMLVYLSDVFYILLHKSRYYIFDPWRTVTTMHARILYSKLLATNTINGVWNLIIYHESKKRLPYPFFSSFFFEFFFMKKVPKRCHFWTPHFWGSLCIFGLILPPYDHTSFCIFLQKW